MGRREESPGLQSLVCHYEKALTETSFSSYDDSKLLLRRYRHILRAKEDEEPLKSYSTQFKRHLWLRGTVRQAGCLHTERIKYNCVWPE